MERAVAQKALFYAMTIGERLLISGAEVSRVEDTIRRVALAYGAERVDVFSITSSIVSTLYFNCDQCVTQTRRVSSSANDFSAIDQLNQLSRTICAARPDFEWIRAELARIDARRRYSPGALIAIYALVSAAFTVFFGGGARDMLASAAIGAALRLVEMALKPAAFNRMLAVFLCGCVGGLLANLATLLVPGCRTDLISIGNIMLFIPGFAFINSLRDLLSGDTIIGLIRFFESLLLAILLALGFALANLIF